MTQINVIVHRRVRRVRRENKNFKNALLLCSVISAFSVVNRKMMNGYR